MNLYTPEAFSGVITRLAIIILLRDIKAPENGPQPCRASPAVGPTQASGVQHSIVQGPVRLTGGIYIDPLTRDAPASWN